MAGLPGLFAAMLFLFIPASMASLFVGTAVQGRPVPFRLLLRAAVALGVSLLLLRYFAYGLHTPLFALLLVVAIRLLSRGVWVYAILGALGAQVATVIGEGLFVVPLSRALSIPLTRLLSDSWLQIGFGHVGNLLLYAIALGLWIRIRRSRAGGVS